MGLRLSSPDVVVSLVVISISLLSLCSIVLTAYTPMGICCQHRPAKPSPSPVGGHYDPMPSPEAGT